VEIKKPCNVYEELREDLSYMHVAELKKTLESFRLFSKAFNKEELIDRLVHFAATGKELAPKKIPAISKAQRGVVYLLAPQTLMLEGAYKNDYVTRQFFKTLIGPHFHYTAWGIDWLREKWLSGTPPTYAQFAYVWKAEYERNKQHKRAPKQEWAYIRFVQAYMQWAPHAAREEVHAAWEVERKKHVAKAQAMLTALRF